LFYIFFSYTSHICSTVFCYCCCCLLFYRTCTHYKIHSQLMCFAFISRSPSNSSMLSTVTASAVFTSLISILILKKIFLKVHNEIFMVYIFFLYATLWGICNMRTRFGLVCEKIIILCGCFENVNEHPKKIINDHKEECLKGRLLDLFILLSLINFDYMKPSHK
jgi:hypothetical protein